MRTIICLFLCLSACGQARSKPQPPPTPTEEIEAAEDPLDSVPDEPQETTSDVQAAAALPFPIPGLPGGIPNIPGLPTNPRPLPAPTPAPTPAPPPCTVPAPNPTPAPTPNTAPVTALFEEINKQRQQRGLSTLTVNADLNCATAIHAKDVGNRRVCSHTGADNSSPWDRIKRCGDGKTFATGEIIACGQTTPVSAVQAWIGSPGHNRIMFDAQNKRMGAAVVNNYWVVLFSKD